MVLEVRLKKRKNLETIMVSRLFCGAAGQIRTADLILTKDGQHFHSEIDLHDEVNDYNSIRSIIPCQGVSAVYLDDDGDSEICPCAFVMLMSDGKIEPFVFATDKDIERIANKDHTGFIGFVPTK